MSNLIGIKMKLFLLKSIDIGDTRVNTSRNDTLAVEAIKHRVIHRIKLTFQPFASRYFTFTACPE